VSPHYLVDANVLSERLRPRPNLSLIKRLTDLEQQVAVAAPVWHEPLYGARRLPPSSRRRALEQYLNDVVRATLPILPYDHAAAEWHAAERARLANIGKTPPYVDGQIAAIARMNDLTLVTANAADFVNFADLRVEDWRS
jgi:tRNA(fMet)-specific endonuclease VapC